MTLLECLKILELPSNYTQVQLKKQYRMLVLKYHPDRNQGQTEKKFQQIQLAYNTIRLYNTPEHKAKSKKTQTHSPSQDQYFKQRVAAERYKQKMEHLKRVYEFQKKKEQKYLRDYIRNLSIGLLSIMILVLIIFILNAL